MLIKTDHYPAHLTIPFFLRLLFLAVVSVFISSPITAEPLPYPTFQFSGFIQYDAGLTGYQENDFRLRRFRTDLKGKLSSQIDYAVHVDHASGTSQLVDGFADIHIFPQGTLRIGKAKSPVGLEVLQSPTDPVFSESGFSTLLVPGRDTGAQFTYKTSSAIFTLAALSGSLDGSNSNGDTDRSRATAARVFWTPLKRTGHTIGLGLAGTVESKDGYYTSANDSNPQLPTYEYNGIGSLFNYNSTSYSKGTNYRIVPQTYGYFGPWGAWGEYVYESVNIRSGDHKAALGHQAWQLMGEYVLTGEFASYGDVLPYSSYINGQGSGAWILGIRVGQLILDGHTDSHFADSDQTQRATQYGVVLHWIWSERIKWILDLEQVVLKRFDQNTRTHTLLGLRTQIKF